MNIAYLTNACRLAIVCNHKQHTVVHIHLSRNKHTLKQYSVTHQLWRGPENRQINRGCPSMMSDNTVAAPDAEDATTSTEHVILAFWIPSSGQKLFTGRYMRWVKPGLMSADMWEQLGKWRLGDRPSLTNTGKTGSPQPVGRGSSIISPKSTKKNLSM